MAEIDVQQKQRSVWAWVLGAITMVALVWILVALLDRDPAASEPFGAIDAPAGVRGAALSVVTTDRPWMAA